MHKSLENCAPRWAVSRISKRKCGCGHQYSRSDIVQIGIRKVSVYNVETKKDYPRESLAIEVLCPECSKGAVTTFSHQSNSFRDLLCTLLEEMQKIDHLEQAQMLEGGCMLQSKISDKEVSEFKDKMAKISNYADFLKELGIETDEDK